MGLTVLASLLFVGSASAESTALDTGDNVAISFWIATAMMLASTIIFLVERSNVAPKWRTSVTVAALVTGVLVVSLHLHERPLGNDWRKSSGPKIC